MRKPTKDGAPAAVKLAPVPPHDPEEQVRRFERGILLFQAQDFRGALAEFEAAAGGPAPEIGHAARQRARICERRLPAAEPQLISTEDYYNYAVALINQRRWEQAESNLMKALAQSPRADHLYYALALCRGSRGDLEGAYQNMKRAIELQPHNLVTARKDPDFAELGRKPPLSGLLNPEKTPPL